MRYPFTILAVVMVLAASLAGVVPSAHARSDSQTRAQALTEAFSRKLETARPYPLGSVDDSGERGNLTERLLRMNNPNKIGYVALVAQTGQVIATFTIKGKVSSTGSQLTNSQNTYTFNCGDKNEDHCPVAVASMSDDGSYGSEEGGPDGVFFFTAQGVLIEWNGQWTYSDAPINLVSVPMVALPDNAQPSTNEHRLLGDGQH